MGPAHGAFQTVAPFHSVAGGMVDWSGLGGWGDRRWEVERAGVGGRRRKPKLEKDRRLEGSWRKGERRRST